VTLRAVGCSSNALPFEALCDFCTAPVAMSVRLPLACTHVRTRSQWVGKWERYENVWAISFLVKIAQKCTAKPIKVKVNFSQERAMKAHRGE
jgi:hypothetical protein